MKNIVLFGLSFVVMVWVTTPGLVIAADEDRVVSVRSQEEIAAQLAEIMAQLKYLEAEMLQKATTDSKLFMIAVDEETITTVPIKLMTRIKAKEQCENAAYDTDYMWRLVTCSYGKEVLYRGVFIAG